MKLDYKKYSGVPFLEHGRDTDGWDCWGIYRHIFNDFCGVLLPEFSDCYEGILSSRNAIASEIKAQRMTWKEVFDPKESDGVLLRLRGIPMHIGYVLPNNQFIHCLDGEGTVVENYTHVLWRNRVLGFYRYE